MQWRRSWIFKMAIKNKLATPAWIMEGYDSEEEYNKKKGISSTKRKGKTFKIRECPKCGSDNVGVIISGKEGKGTKGWECHKCKWTGYDIKEEEFTEDELMKYMDKKNEGVA